MNGYMNEEMSKWELKRWWMHFSLYGFPFRNLSIFIFVSGRLSFLITSDFKTEAGFPTMLLSFVEEINSVSFVCMYYIVLFSDVHLGCAAECNYRSYSNHIAYISWAMAMFLTINSICKMMTTFILLGYNGDK